MELSKFEKGHSEFFLYCHECGGYAYKPSIAREHMETIHGRDPEFTKIWWPD